MFWRSRGSKPKYSIRVAPTLVPPLLSTSVRPRWSFKMQYVSAFWSKKAEITWDIGANLIEYFGWLWYHPYWVLRFTPFGTPKTHTYHKFLMKMPIVRHKKWRPPGLSSKPTDLMVFDGIWRYFRIPLEPRGTGTTLIEHFGSHSLELQNDRRISILMPKWRDNSRHKTREVT